MATSIIQVRMDSTLKERNRSSSQKHGTQYVYCNPSFCRQVINQGRIPFDIVAPTIPNAETKKVPDDGLTDKNLSRSSSSVDEI